MNHRLVSVVGLVACTSLLFGGSVVQSLHAQDLGIAVGAMAPDVPLETLEGKSVQLKSLFAGKPAVLEFWAAWCGNCKQLEPEITAAYDRYKDRVEFLTVAVSLNQTVAQVKQYRDRYKLPFTFLYDRRGEASEAYDAPATSFVVIIDKSGKVVYTGVGGGQKLESALQKAVGTPQ